MKKKMEEEQLQEVQTSKNDVGLIRTDASEENRFLVYRIRPLCHHAYWSGLLLVKRKIEEKQL